MMRQILYLLIGFFSLTACSKPELPAHFSDLLKRSGLMFTEPNGFNRIEPIKNKLMNWEMAYLHSRKKFEIRYAIRPMDSLLTDYKERESNKPDSEILIHPNQLYQSAFKACLLNISDGQLPEYTVYDAISVKNDFHADWGATAITRPGKEFGLDYAYCLVVFIHKQNQGDAYIFFLADDREMLINDMRAFLHNLKFNNKA